VADHGPPLPSADEAARWLAKADDDLLVAELIRQGAPGAAWAACFHAQQAAEKALKAVLVVQGIDFPGSHALDRLAALLPAELRVRFDDQALEALTPWAIAGRYAEEIASPDAATTAGRVAMAREVVSVARASLDP
jgi:HEPN domain-containing protein